MVKCYLLMVIYDTFMNFFSGTTTLDMDQFALDYLVAY